MSIPLPPITGNNKEGSVSVRPNDAAAASTRLLNSSIPLARSTITSSGAAGAASAGVVVGVNGKPSPHASTAHSSHASSSKNGKRPPAAELKYSRNLLNQVRLGKGRCVKDVQDYIAAHPEVQKKFVHTRTVELINLKHKAKMMWHRDASSHLKRVESKARDMSTYTNPMGTRQIPPPRYEEQRRNNNNNNSNSVRSVSKSRNSSSCIC
eukprot:PhM_4_TR14280/c0_g1_i1/m.86272